MEEATEMLAKLMASLAAPIVSSIIAPFTDLFKAYLGKQISMEELHAGMVKALITAAASVEQTHAQEITKSYAAFMEAATKSALLRVVWAAVTLSQLFVLLWHQLGIPFLCYVVGDKSCYPSSGTTVVWAYALLGFCIGAGPLVLRAGPGAIDPSKWTALAKK